MRKTMIVMTLVLALIGGACAGDVTESDEYRDLEEEFAALEQDLADTEAELGAVQVDLTNVATSEVEVPADVVDVIDEWWAANERKDGSVADLYLPSGYHLYGDQRIMRDALADHFGAEGWTSELIAGPFLVVAEPEGRYVVTIGVRNTYQGVTSAASALTFEIVTRGGTLQIAESDWLYVTS